MTTTFVVGDRMRPNVVGMTTDLALQTLAEAYFLNVTVFGSFGTIKGQDPPGDQLGDPTLLVSLDALSPVPDITATLATGVHTFDATGYFAAPATTISGVLPTGWSFLLGIFTYLTTIEGTFGPFMITDADGNDSNEFYVIVSALVVAEPVHTIRFTPTFRSMTFTVH